MLLGIQIDNAATETDQAGERIALFGGSFDPIHLGHHFIASRAREAIGLDRVIVIPAFRSPFKTDRKSADGIHRLEMARLATANELGLEVSSYEIDLEDTSYSWRTAEHFSEQNPKARLFWILGADQWEALPRWSRPEHFASLVEFIVFRRDGQKTVEREGYRAHFVDGTFSASSTQIRELLGTGSSDRIDTLHPDVERYARKNALYE